MTAHACIVHALTYWMQWMAKRIKEGMVFYVSATEKFKAFTPENIPEKHIEQYKILKESMNDACKHNPNPPATA